MAKTETPTPKQTLNTEPAEKLADTSKAKAASDAKAAPKPVIAVKSAKPDSKPVAAVKSAKPDSKPVAAVKSAKPDSKLVAPVKSAKPDSKLVAAVKSAKPDPQPVVKVQDAKTSAPQVKTLAVDIGGSGVKAMLLDAAGKPLSDRLRAPTPARPTPQAISAIIADFAQQLGDYQRVSVGFPGVVRGGTIETAHNLDAAWIGYPLATQLSAKLGKPVRVANDAVVQGLGGVSGKGVELVITLGTGMGSALYIDGVPLPSLELAHHPFHDNRTYEDDLGRRALDKHGPKKWNKRLAEAIELLHNLFYYDHLYIGGGNSKKVTLKLPPNVTIISNEDGILGGIKLWARPIE